jgi:hypothetical protein
MVGAMKVQGSLAFAVSIALLKLNESAIRLGYRESPGRSFPTSPHSGAEGPASRPRKNGPHLRASSPRQQHAQTADQQSRKY